MSDFFQNGVITTLHRLGSQTIERLESRLDEYAHVHPMALAALAIPAGIILGVIAFFRTF